MKSEISLALGIFVIVVAFIMVVYSFSVPRESSIILPAGGTYLGP